MAQDTSEFKLAVKLFLVIFIQFQAARKCHVFGNQDLSKEYVFSPHVIMQVLEQSSFVGISKSALEELFDVYTGIQKAFAEEERVVIGLIDVENFVWPSGNPLKTDEVSEITNDILLFPRRENDRTCLSTVGLSKKDPVAESYTGIKTIDILVEFINQKCDTYRTKSGYLSIEGLHRQEILKSLFHVQNISDVDMEHLLTESKGSYCSKEACKKDNEKSSIRNQKSKDELESKIAVQHHSGLDFKDEEFKIQRCEQKPLPSKEEFFNKYLKLSKPVIFKNAIYHWPAMKKWTNEYFKTNYGDRSVHIKLTPLGEFEGVDLASNFENYNIFTIPNYVKTQLLFPDLVVVRPATKNMNFSSFLDVVESVANGSRSGFSAYLEYSSIAEIMPELEGDVIEMPFIQKMLQLKHLNIWLSDGNTLGKLHFDPFDNFLCQLSGRKQVMLFDPHDNRRQYEAHIPEAVLAYNETTKMFTKKQLVDTTSMVMSPVDITRPDLERFPLFSSVHPLNCTIDEGDVLFMPAFWWHEVQSYPNKEQGRNLAVNFWYEPFLQKEFPCQECRLDVNPKYRHLL
ncbi:jmjC domain-containing protein D-like [Mercenaria mercenaria]|uniref:jmjC domain-containing protein D-like n=1 Tax=Mercenaria mercenaria TaxID=6596 RepID=UPI00234ED4F4|nr:jmjC domain-containing protein D-like [Mercenaria mercenaria]